MRSMVRGRTLSLTDPADVQEYLLLKGVEAVAIHGSKSALVFGEPQLTVAAQEEREYAIRSFKAGKKDVMVASGVASKVRPISPD